MQVSGGSGKKKKQNVEENGEWFLKSVRKESSKCSEPLRKLYPWFIGYEFSGYVFRARFVMMIVHVNPAPKIESL